MAIRRSPVAAVPINPNEASDTMTSAQPSTAVSAADLAEIRALFLRQAAGETAHDIAAIEAVLARALPGEPDPVNFIARAYRFWGREAVIEHFRAVFTGTWRFEPDEEAIGICPSALTQRISLRRRASPQARPTSRRRLPRFWSTNSRSAPRRLAHLGHRSRPGAVIGVTDSKHEVRVRPPSDRRHRRSCRKHCAR